jgi:DNA-binding transcriptional MerR regulator/methylmalonyl-CoA mutase cobalamin-binding subunit
MLDQAAYREARHPIRVVTERTGLSPDLLRAWERRYGVVNPSRNEGGQRLYSDADIHRLSLLCKASQGGRAVGQVAALPPEELARLVAEDADHGAVRPTPAGDHLARAFAAVHDLEPERLRWVLRRAVLSLGVPAFLEQVLTPLLVQIGEEWHAGRLGIAHEHAATAAVEQLLGWIVQEFAVPEDAPRVLLATPARSRHSLGAMIAAVAAAQDGWHVIWLGTDLPAGQIALAARRHGADVVGLSVIAAEDPDAVSAEVAALRDELAAETPLLIGGSGAAALRPVAGLTAVRDLTHWRSLLRSHAPAA